MSIDTSYASHFQISISDPPKLGVLTHIWLSVLSELLVHLALHQTFVGFLFLTNLFLDVVQF